MTVRVRLTPPAAADLEQIVDYRMNESLQLASRFSSRIASVLDTLAEFPDRGRATSRKDIRSVNTFPFPYVIFFRRKATEIEVLRIIHGARDPKSMPARLT